MRTLLMILIFMISFAAFGDCCQADMDSCCENTTSVIESVETEACHCEVLCFGTILVQRNALGVLLRVNCDDCDPYLGNFTRPRTLPFLIIRPPITLS